MHPTGFMQVDSTLPLSEGDSSALYIKHRDVFCFLSPMSSLNQLALFVFIGCFMEMKSTVSKGSETPGTLLEGFGGEGSHLL